MRINLHNLITSILSGIIICTYLIYLHAYCGLPTWTMYLLVVMAALLLAHTVPVVYKDE